MDETWIYRLLRVTTPKAHHPAAAASSRPGKIQRTSRLRAPSVTGTSPALIAEFPDFPQQVLDRDSWFLGTAACAGSRGRG